MKKYLKISGIICIFYIVMSIIIYVLGSWINYEEIKLDDAISIEIQRENGQIEKIKGNKFNQINTKDRVLVTIPIPKDVSYAYPALCFTTFSSITKIWYEEELLYSYGEEIAEEGRMIGTIYDSAVLPEKVLGNTVIMECIATERGAMNQISNLILMEATESSKYPIIHNLIDLIIFLTIFVVSSLGYHICLFLDKKDHINRISLWLTQMTHVISLYILVSQGFLHPLVNNFRVLANLEYILIFSLPIPFGLFFYDIYENKILKKIIKHVLFVNVLFFLVCTVLNYTTANYHYVFFLPYLHAEIILSVVVYCIGIFLKTEEEEKEEWITLVRSGILIFVVFSVVEIIMFYVAKKSNNVIFRLKMLPMGVILVLSILTLGIVMKLLERFREIEKQKQLEQMAYFDILTGLETRAKCYTLIEKIKKERILEYTIFYIDLNDLKYYNDKFGHTMGDNYIKTMAGIMKQTFVQADTISRFGGDEFIVLYLKNIEENVENYINDFHRRLKEANKNREYPFLIDAACGTVSSTKNNPMEIEAAIATADQRMYEDKKYRKEIKGKNGE